jgi:hypothetical protein
MQDEQIKVYVLMPFNDTDKITYKYAICPAIEDSLKKYSSKFEIKRADDYAAIEPSKPQVIMDAIAKSDVTIVDFSGNNPNIMWELGYCDALKKSVY